MTDSSSQNPSDPQGKPDAGRNFPKGPDEEKSLSKLKLKQLLTPLSSHLNVENSDRDKGLEEYRPRIEIPRAVPMDPEPELAPHERPPSPDGAPLNADSLYQGQPGYAVHAQGMQHTTHPNWNHPDQVDQNAHDPEQEEQPEEIEKLVSAPDKKPGKFKKVALPVVCFLVVLAGIQYYMDPLGLTIDPIESGAPIILSEPAQTTDKNEIPASLAPVTLSLELEKITVESFLGVLGKLEIIPSSNPHGAIIDSVFYPEGSRLNPALGLVLSSVGESSITITDNSGREYEFQVN